MRSRSLATSTVDAGITRRHRLAVGAGRAARVAGVDQPDAGVRQFVDLLDRHAALLGEQPYVVEVGARAGAGRGSSTGTRRSSTRVVSPTPGLTRLTSSMPYSSLIRSTAAQPSQVGVAVGGEQLLRPRRRRPSATSAKRAATASRKSHGDVGAGEFAVELRAVEVVRADQVGAQDGARDQARRRWS